MKPYYFIGIGGIGMSALARYMKALGHPVAGYDKTPSPLTTQLADEGIFIQFEDDITLTPADFKGQEVEVIWTPAIPNSNDLLNHFQSAGNSMRKRAELLADVARTKTCIAVAGTHGKTTTTSILAHLLFESELGCTAFVGGVLTGFESNLLLNPESQFVVLEADEFDRSFHHLDPSYAILTSTDADHLDIYGDSKSIQEAFRDFVEGVSEQVFIHEDIDISVANQLSYGQSDSADIRLMEYGHDAGQAVFTLQFNQEELKFRSPLPGLHNLLNASAALAVALSLGVTVESARKALSTYRGVKRRFERVLDTPDFVFIDDYAHHPTEIRAAIGAARELYPQHKLTVVFQPHLYSRTRDFMDGFAESLSLADELILLPIYPAREEPIPGIKSEALLERVTITNKSMCEKAQLPKSIEGSQLEILLTLGAGDIDRLIEPLEAVLTKRLDSATYE